MPALVVKHIMMFLFLSSDASSQPVAALPLVLQSIRADILASHCADITCWQRSALRLDSALMGALSGLGDMQSKVDAKDAQIGALTTQLATESSALTMAGGTLKQDSAALERRWYEHPTLILSIGIVLGGALVYGAVAAWNGLAHALTH